MNLPPTFQETITKTTDSLKMTFKQVGSLNGHRNAPMPEQNTIVHFAASLIGAGFAVYAEPALPSKRRRIDILASNNQFTFVVEVKAFGDLKLKELLDDAGRLASFEPQTHPRFDRVDPEEFWKNTEKWGVILIQSFAGEKFNQLWWKQTSADKEFATLLESYEYLDSHGKKDFSKLASFLLSRQAHLGVKPICSDIWADDTERLDLLWAAFAL
jgi:hypothetical protein